jgi:hypothetical protein
LAFNYVLAFYDDCIESAPASKYKTNPKTSAWFNNTLLWLSDEEQHQKQCLNF